MSEVDLLTLKGSLNSSGFSCAVLSELALSTDHTDRLLDFTDHQAQAQRPLFHITPDFGWSNDPNGMLEYNGVHHVFFQHTPNESMTPLQLIPNFSYIYCDPNIFCSNLPDVVYRWLISIAQEDGSIRICLVDMGMAHIAHMCVNEGR